MTEPYFKDTLEYMHDVVRQILDKSLELCNLGIVTGGVLNLMKDIANSLQRTALSPILSFNGACHERGCVELSS